VTVVISDSSVEARGGLTPRERPAGQPAVRGRKAEQKAIRDLLRRAQRGAGGVLLVDGEPGIGKSLLLRDATDTAAGLVAEGLNNAQVAARMYISAHTVAHHLRQAFRKLSIASRVELTRIVIEHAAASPLGLIIQQERS
jgi:DNA-binding CsgD family transcriptional regulator